MKQQLFTLSSVASLLLACTTGSAKESGPVKLLQTPDSGIQPQAVMDAKGVLHLIYLKGEPQACDVFYVRREAARTNFSAPLRVNSQPGSAVALGTVRGAQLAIGRNGRIHVVWNSSGRAAPKTDEGAPMLYTRLNDNGTAFEAQRNVMTSTRHLDGGGSVAADLQGNIYVVWHGHARDVAQDELHRAVFITKSMDDGKTFAPEQQANPEQTGACSCCGLKAYVDERGQLAVLYRSASSTGGRDVILLLSTNHAKTFRSKVLGPWQVTMCPMSTMALGQGTGSALAAMWETQGQVYCSEIIPDKLDLNVPTFAPEGKASSRKHPVLAANGSRLLLAWTEGTGWGQGGSLAWECVDLTIARKLSCHAGGVRAWSRIAAVAEPDGSFTIVY